MTKSQTHDEVGIFSRKEKKNDMEQDTAIHLQIIFDDLPALCVSINLLLT